MMARTQISLEPELQRRVRRRAAQLGVSFAEFVRRALERDLGPPRRPVAVSRVFALGDSGGSDVARHKDEMVGEAVAAQQRRRRARR
jgi:Ribbon-helix-helix protein, copG family